MAGDLDYADEKFGLALHGMATSDAPLRERLRTAYMGVITAVTQEMGGLGPSFSPELWARVSALDRRMTATEASGDEGTLAATIMAMSDRPAPDVERRGSGRQAEIADLRAG
jgi:hypothetical protein